jgi:hypothetical protein
VTYAIVHDERAAGHVERETDRVAPFAQAKVDAIHAGTRLDHLAPAVRPVQLEARVGSVHAPCVEPCEVGDAHSAVGGDEIGVQLLELESHGVSFLSWVVPSSSPAADALPVETAGDKDDRRRGEDDSPVHETAGSGAISRDGADGGRPARARGDGEGEE